MYMYFICIVDVFVCRVWLIFSVDKLLCRWSITTCQENEVRLSQIVTLDRSSFCIQRYYGLHFTLFQTSNVPLYLCDADLEY